MRKTAFLVAEATSVLVKGIGEIKTAIPFGNDNQRATTTAEIAQQRQQVVRDDNQEAMASATIAEPL